MSKIDTAFRAWANGLLAGCVAAAGLAFVAGPAMAQDDANNPANEALRVCADPSNMPFSSDEREGFENKIAALLGEKLGVPVEYEWMPEQMGFGRNTLKRWVAKENRYACDLVISVGSAFDVGKATRPYYRSTYVMAYRKNHGLDSIKTPNDLLELADAKKQDLRIGVFTGSPAGDWFVQHGMLAQVVSYRAQSGGYDVDPADMITQGLVNGDVDIAVVWGPIAGYYAKQVDADIAIVPFTRKDGTQFDFPVSMGVRYGNDAWYDKVQKLIDDNREQILSILEDYGVPLVPLRDEDRQPPEDDDD